MKTPTLDYAAMKLPARAASDFDTLFDLVDLVLGFINIINSIIETLLNFGDYLNGE